ncbi:MAG TPA: helix-turn-helix domain-containing protein [Acholeplasma sp.]|jgi:DNA replication protein
MLKKLYEEHVLLIESLITKEQKRLKLTSNQLVVLLALFSMYKKRVFSINAIAKRVDIDENDIGRAIDKLIEKGFVTISLEKRNDKEQEVFDLSGTFDKIKALYEEDIVESKKEESESKIGITIQKLEQNLGKTLSAYELDTVRRWYDENLYPHDMIIRKIDELGTSARFSLKFLERNLMKESFDQTKQPDQVDEVLDKIFKAIK